MSTDNELTYKIIGAAMEVHRVLGPGLMESAYEAALAAELHERNIPFQRQYQLDLDYKGTAISCGYRIDLLVDDSVILELKSVEALLPIHEAQILTYLKLSGLSLGLLLNFNVPVMKSGIRRFVRTADSFSVSSVPSAVNNP